MALRAVRTQPHIQLGTQFGTFLSMLLGAAILAVIAVVFAIHPQLRSTAAWMPYDTGKELTMSGLVEDFRIGQCPWCGPGAGAHLLLRTQEGLVEVHLADAGFLRKHGYKFVKGDLVEVLGAKLIYDGGTSLLAREVRRGDQRIVLRDARGTPLWIVE